MGEVLEEDVDGVGCAVRALELLSRQDGLVRFDEGVEGVICGRAIYSGDLDFQAAQARADELND